MFRFLGGDLLLATDSGLADKIKEPALRVLYRYWDEARAMAPLPRSRDINPASLPTLVSNIVLIETARKLDKFRFGLIGSSVRAYFGEALQGNRKGLTRGEGDDLIILPLKGEGSLVLIGPKAETSTAS